MIIWGGGEGGSFKQLHIYFYQCFISENIIGLDSISKPIYNVWSHFGLNQSLRRLSCNNSIKFQ